MALCVFFYPPPSLHPYTPIIASTVSLSLLWKLTLPKSQIASTVSRRFLEQNLFPNTKSQAPWPFVFFYPPPSLHPYTSIIASTVSLSLLWKLTLPKSQIASAVPLSFFLKILPKHSIASTVPLEFWKLPLPKAQIASTVSLGYLEQNLFPKNQIASTVALCFFLPTSIAPPLHPHRPSLHSYTFPLLHSPSSTPSTTSSPPKTVFAPCPPPHPPHHTPPNPSRPCFHLCHVLIMFIIFLASSSLFYHIYHPVHYI